MRALPVCRGRWQSSSAVTHDDSATRGAELGLGDVGAQVKKSALMRREVVREARLGVLERVEHGVSAPRVGEQGEQTLLQLLHPRAEPLDPLRPVRVDLLQVGFFEGSLEDLVIAGRLRPRSCSRRSIWCINFILAL